MGKVFKKERLLSTVKLNELEAQGYELVTFQTNLEGSACYILRSR
jgi:hypothetical protein